MNIDSSNLQIKLWRGRTQTIALRVGTWVANTPPPGGQQSFSFQPGNITNWWFAYTMRTNYTLQQPQIALTYNPIQNILDPRQGQMGFNIVGSDLEPLIPSNYVFDMAVTIGGGQPRFFCGGVAILYDNVTDSPVTTAAKYPKIPPSPSPLSGGDMYKADFVKGTGSANPNEVDHAQYADAAPAPTGLMPLTGSGNLGQLQLATTLDDPSQVGEQGGYVAFYDAAGSGQALALSTKYVGWKCATGTPQTAIYVDANGDLYAYQISGPNAGKRVDLTKNGWR